MWRHSKNLKLVMVTILLMALAWILQHWFYAPEIIAVEGRQVMIIDGDSFRSEDSEYRIYGIDAPEYRQTCTEADGTPWNCGRDARDALQSEMRTKDYSCEVRAKDQYQRAVVSCTDSDGRDLGASLVRQGAAFSGTSFDELIYSKEERQAERLRKGIWRGEAMRPEKWREQNPRTIEPR